MTQFVEFTGQLDKAAGFVPFDGKLDEPTSNGTKIEPDFTTASGAGDVSAMYAAPAKEAGGGRGFVNPPAAVPPRDLLPDSWVGVKHTVLNVLGAWDKGAAAISDAMPDWMPGKMTPEQRAQTLERGTYMQEAAAQPENTPERASGSVTSALTYVPFAEAAPVVMGGTEGAALKNTLVQQGVDEDTATKAAFAYGTVTAATAMLPMGNVGGATVKQVVTSGVKATAKAGGVGVAQSVAGDAAVSGLLKAGGYDDLAEQYKPTPDKAMDSATFMAAFHLGSQAAHHLATVAGRQVGRAPQQDVDGSQLTPPIDQATADSQNKVETISTLPDAAPKTTPADILHTDNIDDAIATANKAAADGKVELSDELLALRPLKPIAAPSDVAGHVDLAQAEENALRQVAGDTNSPDQGAAAIELARRAEEANVSQPSDVSAIPATTNGSRGADAGAGVLAGTRIPGPAGHAVDTGALRTEPEGQPVPLADAGRANAVEPASTWFGRRGDGYVSIEDAQKALPSRQKVDADLDWRIEQMPSGKFRLAGYDATEGQSDHAQSQTPDAQGNEAAVAPGSASGRLRAQDLRPNGDAAIAGDGRPVADYAQVPGRPVAEIRPDGTLWVRGNPTEIQTRAPGGIRGTEGVLYPKQRAAEVQQQFAPAEARALQGEPAVVPKDLETTASTTQATLFRRSDNEAQIGKSAQIHEAVSQLTKGWLRKPDIHVLHSMDEAPDAVRAQWERQNSQGASGAIEGFHYRGGVYLVADTLSTKGEVQRTLYHESLGHFGLRGVFGERLDGVLREVAAVMPKEVATKAKQYGLDVGNEKHRLTAAEEVLAELAQTRPELGLVRRAVAAIRTFLREHGIDSLKMSHDEIVRNFILPARGYVERARNPEPSFAKSDATQFSRDSEADVVHLDPSVLTGPIAQKVLQAREIAYREYANRSVVNKSDGSEILIPKTGIKHALSGQVSEVAAQAATRLGEVVSSARFERAEPDKLGRPEIKEVRHYTATVDIAGRQVEVGVVVRETRDGRRYYDHFELKKQTPAGLIREAGGPDLTRPFAGDAAPDGMSGATSETRASESQKLGDQPTPNDPGIVPPKNDAAFSRTKTATAEEEPTPERKPTFGAPMIDGAKALLHDAYMAVAPMSAGEQKPQAGAQQFANDVRTARYQWQKMSTLIKAKFSPVEREQMWRAAEEENIERLKAGRDENYARPEGNGLDSLNAKQRATMETLHAYGNELWQRAKAVGMVEGEGLPFWSPRSAVMIGEDGSFSKPPEPGKKTSSSGDGRNVFTTAPSAKHRAHETLEESESALKGKLGEGAQYVKDILTMPLAMSRFEQAIAGRELVNSIKEIGLATGKEMVNSSGGEGFFTLDHPAFSSYKPRFAQVDGKTAAIKDAEGNVIMDRVPLFIDKSWEGPLKAVMSGKDNAVYSAYMLLKSKAMTAIMYSPLIHNQAIFGRALGYTDVTKGGPLKTVGLYFTGHSAKKDPEFMRRMIGSGMVPIGEHNNMLDVGDIANGGAREGSWSDPNESWIGLSAKAVGNKLHEGLGDAAKGGIDALGDFWHNTLLWRRVGDLQAGIAKDAYESLVGKGFDPDVASVAAAHLANRYAGAIGQENMSRAAHMAANIYFFSKSFNAANIGTVKDAAFGTTAGLRALINERAQSPKEAERMMLFLQNKARFGLARDLAYSIIAMNLAQMWFKRDKDADWSMDSVKKGMSHQVELAVKAWANLQDHPTDLNSYNPYRMAGTYDNEPGKQQRVFEGLQESGRGQYMRLPMGKVVEDLGNWIFDSAKTADAKQSPLMKGVTAIARNKKDDYGTPIWDNRDPNFAHRLSDAAMFLLGTHAPVDQAKTIKDLVTGHATQLDKDKTLGNFTGLSVSQGHPGGPEAGVAAEVEASVKASQQHAMDEVKRLLKYGKSEEAWETLEKSGLTPKEISHIIQRVNDPKAIISRSTLKKFNAHATPEEQRRMEDVTQ